MSDFFLHFPDHFQRPWLLLLLGLGVPIIWLGRRSLASLVPARRRMAIALRLLVLLLIVLLLTGFQHVQRHSGLTLLSVVDQSPSVRRFARAPDAQDTPEHSSTWWQWLSGQLREGSRDRRGDDRFGLLTYDQRPMVRVMPSQVVDMDSGTIEHHGTGSDSAAALRSAMALFPPDTGKRILWVSDGNDTVADGRHSEVSRLLAAAYEAAAAGIAIDVLPVRYQVENEVMLDALYTPLEAREGQSIPVRVVLRATEPVSGRLYLLHDDQAVNLDPDAQQMGAAVRPEHWTLEQADADIEALERQGLANARYLAVQQLDLPIDHAGLHRFKAVFEPDDPAADTIAMNNEAESFTIVAGRGRILLVDNVGGEPGQILPDALRSRDLELEVIAPGAFPASLETLQRYDAVILHNVPATFLSTAQQRMLARYVHDLGGGLVKIGGPQSFGAGAWIGSPLEDVLPLTAEIPSQQVLPAGALMLVIDRSGSMGAFVSGTSQSRQDVANEASVLALGTLYPQDYLGVIAFDTQARTIVELAPNQNFPEVARRVRSIKPGGGTDIHAGLQAAYRQLATLTPDEVALKHVIMLTDGHTAPANWLRLMGNMRQAGITMTTVAVGEDVDEALLRQLAQMGNGMYYQVLDPRELPQIFVKEARTIRRNLLKEKTFEPQILTTGSPVMAGITALPALEGIVLTAPRDDPRVFMPIISDEGDPVFAHWQVGLGRVAAFTSDATNRWARAWVAWPGYTDFWMRTVQAMARPSAARHVDIQSAVHGQRLDIRLDLASLQVPGAGGSGQTATGGVRQLQASVLRPDGQVERLAFTQTGPGLFEASAAALLAGNYIVEVNLQHADGTTQRVTTGASRLPGDEYRFFQSNLQVLEQVAQITGGRMIDPDQEPIGDLFARREIYQSMTVQPLGPWFMALLLAVLLLDVACRRIAWEPREIAAWVTGGHGVLLESLRRGQGSARQTMSALKQRRSETARTLAEASDGEPPTVDLTTRAPAATKFEAPTDFQAHTGLHDALDGARRDSGAARDDDPSAPVTSRLLSAKQRARSRFDDPPSSQPPNGPAPGSSTP